MKRRLKKVNSSYLIVASAIFVSILLLGQNVIIPVYALTYSIITTTGTQTNDNCNNATISGDGNIWLWCSPSSGAMSTLSVLTTSGTQLATLTTSSGGVSSQLLPMFGSSNTNKILAKTDTDFKKFSYASGVITQIATYTPSSCTTMSMKASYDSNGFVWFGCGGGATGDNIVVMNPTTMIEKGRSADLTNGVGADCGAIGDAISGDFSGSSTDLVIATCDLNDTVATFSYTTGTTYSISTEPLDTESIATFTNVDDVVIDAVSNRIIFIDTSVGVRLADYVQSTGIISAFTTIMSSPSGAETECLIDDYQILSPRVVVCASTDIVVGYISNATGVFQVMNIGDFDTAPTNQSVLIGTYLGRFDNWVVAQGNANSSVQKFLLINNIPTGTEPDEPPSPDADNDSDSIDNDIDNCPNVYNPSQTDTDNDGIGDACESIPPPVTGGVDCLNPANFNLLICRINEGGGGIGGIGNQTGRGLLDLACNIIFVSCDNPNPKTNGLGLLAFIASLFVVIGMFWYAIGKEAFHMPLFVWIVIVVALSAFFTIAGWIDPIFLVLTIVAIIAMAVPKIVSITKGNTLGGGSTE